MPRLQAQDFLQIWDRLLSATGADIKLGKIKIGLNIIRRQLERLLIEALGLRDFAHFQMKAGQVDSRRQILRIYHRRLPQNCHRFLQQARIPHRHSIIIQKADIG